jgi:hypothetical protein
MAIQGGVRLVGWDVYCCDFPTQGSVSLPATVTLAGTGGSGSYLLDLEIEYETGAIDFCQGLYIDNSANASAITVLNSISQQKVMIPANSQAFVNAMAPSKSKWLFSGLPGLVVPVQVLNFPVATAVWSTLGVPGGAGNPIIVSPNPYTGALYTTQSSANAAAANNLTLSGFVGRSTYLQGFTVSGGGATATSVINITVTGLQTTLNFDLTIPVVGGAGVLLQQTFNPPLQSSGLNTSITVNVPSFGAGNLNAAASAWGYAI